MTRDPDDDVQRLVDQAVEQGFPEKCSDPVTMARIASALNGHTPQKKTAGRSGLRQAVKTEGTAHAASAR